MGSRGHLPVRAGRAADVWPHLRTVDAVLLDLGLPDAEGLDVLRRIRSVGSVPVVILTARNSERDVVRGLRVGADDFVVKPVRLRELLARLDAVTRRSQAPSAGSRAERRSSGSLTDIVLAARNADPPFDSPLDLHAVGRVYEDYMQLVVRAEDPIGDVVDLAGRPVSLGASGSGAAVCGDRLLAAVGIEASVSRRPVQEAAIALESGEIDALLWSGGVPTPALAELAARRPIRLLPLQVHLPRLRERYGSAYGPLSCRPASTGSRKRWSPSASRTFPSVPPRSPIPSQDRSRTLVTSASALVPAAALGAQYLGQRSLIGTGDVPLHDGAAAAYREMHG